MLVEPNAADRPAFLKAIRPDAIATGRLPQLVIEVVGGGGRAEAERIERLRELTTGVPDWELKVVYHRDVAPIIEASSNEDIEAAVRRVDEIARIDRRAALLFAWSSLEAAVMRRTKTRRSRPRPSRTLVYELVSDGLIDPELGDRLFELADVRNALAHGQISSQPTTDDIAVVTDVIRNLSSKPAASAA